MFTGDEQHPEAIAEHYCSDDQDQDPECDSPEVGGRVDLTFHVMNRQGDDFVESFVRTSNIYDVKMKIGNLLKISPENLTVIYKDSTLSDDVKISTLHSENHLGILTKDDAFTSRTIPENATCKFHAVNQNYYFTKLFPRNHSIMMMKENLSEILKVQQNNLLIVKNNSVLDPGTRLIDLDIDNFGNLELELYTEDGVKMKFDAVYKDVPISDILTVAIPVGNNRVINVNVEVIDARIAKPYLGGYRNKITGLEYHHAFAQTQDFRSKLPPEKKNHRDTQTVTVKNVAVDTGTNRGIQVQVNSGLYVPSVSDRILTARPQWPSISQTVVQQKQIESAIRIQKAWRAYRCRKAVGGWLQQCRKRLEDLKKENLEEIRIRDLRLKKQMIAKTYPRTREDFDQLYAMVDRWRNAEIARISKLHTKGPKIAEFGSLLDKEIRLLRSIEKFRTELSEDFKKMKENNLLEEMSKPIVWKDAAGRTITMDTIETRKARELKGLYEEFRRDGVTLEERMRLLVNFKRALADCGSSPARELVSLIDRECEMLVGNVPEKYLDPLRRRIRTALFHFVKGPEFGGDAASKRRERAARRTENERLYYCPRCDAVKARSRFPLRSGKKTLDSCAACARGDFAGGDRVDETPYKFMLRALRRQERKNKCLSSVAFVVQERDVRFIVDKIWHSRSAIGERDDVLDLRLCRWDSRRDWSPWNCILLTFREMKSHLKLNEPEKVYDEDFVRKVRAKLTLAKTHFEHLIEFDDDDRSE